MKLSPQTVSLIGTIAQSASADSVMSEFGSFTRVVATSPLLARTLAQPDLSVDAKAALVNDVVNSRFSQSTIDLIVEAGSGAEDSESVSTALFEALTELAFSSAENKKTATGGIKALEGQLLDMADIIANSEELRDAFANPGVNDEAKVKVLAELLGSRTPVNLRELALTAIPLTHGRGVDGVMRQRAGMAAARRNACIAIISSAVELDEERKRGLLSALTRSTGQEIEGRFIIDPTVIGSLAVRIGDEVFDGTLRHKIQQAREALVGAQ